MCIPGTVQCPVSIKQFENPFLASLGLVCKAALETAFVPHAGPGLSEQLQSGIGLVPGTGLYSSFRVCWSVSVAGLTGDRPGLTLNDELPLFVQRGHHLEL
jgi:hypothetical protein